MYLNNKLIWTITEGSQGMISQVNGLAQQLSPNVLQIKTNLIFPWSKLQPGLLPIYKWVFKNNFDIISKPKIVISCGRKSVYSSLYLKKIFRQNIITIHIQNPKVNSNNFDYVVAPNHDNLDGKNILKTCGAIHHFSQTKKFISFLSNPNPALVRQSVSMIPIKKKKREMPYEGILCKIALISLSENNSKINRVMLHDS